MLHSSVHLLDFLFITFSIYFAVRLARKLFFVSYHYLVSRANYNVQALYLIASIMLAIGYYIALIGLFFGLFTDVLIMMMRALGDTVFCVMLALQLYSKIHTSGAGNLIFKNKTIILLVSFILNLIYIISFSYTISSLDFANATLIPVTKSISILPWMYSIDFSIWSLSMYATLLYFLYYVESQEYKGIRESIWDSPYRRILIKKTYLNGWSPVILYVIISAVLQHIQIKNLGFDIVAYLSYVLLSYGVFSVVNTEIRNFSTNQIYKNGRTIEEINKAINIIASAKEWDEVCQLNFNYLKQECKKDASTRAFLSRKMYLDPYRRDLMYTLTTYSKSSFKTRSRKK